MATTFWPSPSIRCSSVFPDKDKLVKKWKNFRNFWSPALASFSKLCKGKCSNRHHTKNSGTPKRGKLFNFMTGGIFFCLPFFPLFFHAFPPHFFGFIQAEVLRVRRRLLHSLFFCFCCPLCICNHLVIVLLLLPFCALITSISLFRCLINLAKCRLYTYIRMCKTTTTIDPLTFIASPR